MSEPYDATPEWRARRILDRLDTLFAIGQAAGTNRIGLGPGEQRAFELVAGWMEQAGFKGFNEVEIFSRRRWATDQTQYLEDIKTAYFADV